MSARFIAAVLCAALTVTTVTATASDAREHRRDNKKAEAALGIAALIALGLIVADKNRDEGHVTHPVKPRPKPRTKPGRRYELPGQCMRRIETRDGMRRIFGKGCLKRNYHWVRHLPSECRVRVRNRAGHKRSRGYAAWCLKRHGYRLARW